MKYRPWPKSSTTPEGNDSGHFRIVHPYHPLNGHEFEFVARRHNWGDDRVFLFTPEGRLHSVPASWTDLATPDPFVTISAGRSFFRVEDLLALGRLIRSLYQSEEYR